MAAADLNRTNDTPITTLKLNEVAVKNWHRFPTAILRTDIADVNAANEGKPRYNGMTDWAGGAIGDDISASTAAVSIANMSGGANEADYVPRTQAAKAALPGAAPPNLIPNEPDFTLAVDITRPRGWLEPDDPYVAPPASPAADPVISSLTPNTAVSVTGAELVVTITGLRFTQWSTVTSGGYPIPSKYVDATHLTIYQNPKVAVAGATQVVVTDHGVASAPATFTFT